LKAVHLVKDENGNLCAHEHTHPHTHEGHTHTHDHGDACSEGSCDTCKGCNDSGADKNAALLAYMYQHNQSHAAELDQMAAKLAKEGKAQAAEQIRKAVDEFQKGNMYLNLALGMVKEESE